MVPACRSLMLAIAAAGLTTTQRAAPSAQAAVRWSPPTVRLAPLPLRAASPTLAWARRLWPVEILNINTRASAEVRLYRDDGSIDQHALDRFAIVAAPPRYQVEALSTRLVQLSFKAAYHFRAHALVVISAYRCHAGYHSLGDALDFRLPGVDYRRLARYLRAYPRAGVGMYTNPRTRYVHLDVRRRSYHWLDASPPRRTWRAMPLPDPRAATRDAAYDPASDLPLETNGR